MDCSSNKVSNDTNDTTSYPSESLNQGKTDTTPNTTPKVKKTKKESARFKLIMFSFLAVSALIGWIDFILNSFGINLYLHEKAYMLIRKRYLIGCPSFVFSGDKISTEKNVVMMMNHRCDADFIIDLCIGNEIIPKKKMQWIAKKEISKLPFVKKVADYLGFVFIDRDDREKTIKILQKCYKPDLCPIIWPEGRVVNVPNLEYCNEKRKILGLKQRDHVLAPQPLGLFTLIKTGKYNSIIDITYIYEGYDGVKSEESKKSWIPSLENFTFWNREQPIIHVDVRNIPIDPNWTLESFTDFLNKRWDYKETRLRRFVTSQSLIR